ncbi:MAG: methionyl-tRNA formyltransferase [Deltaproteobacteria bacterium]|nr:methionyl-tRNA formyltransferase [Deltaproteobacteria bacterium]
MDSLRVVFMGTPAFAVPSLNAVVTAGFECLAVVTQPDKTVGRGLTTSISAIKKAALDLDIEVRQPERLKEPSFIDWLETIQPDVIVVVAYGKILPEEALRIPRLGCVNLHASLLPRYRGASPINRAIMDGQTSTGACTMLMDKGMDTGPILLCESSEIRPDDTALTLSARLAESGALLLVKTIGLLSQGTLKAIQQDERSATYAPPLKKEDGRIDWTRSAKEIYNLMRGVTPWPGAYTFLNGKTLKIHSGLVRPDGHDNPPGTIIAISNGRLVVACKGSVFEITEVQLENKKRMSADEFMRGVRLKQGERLG